MSKQNEARPSVLPVDIPAPRQMQVGEVVVNYVLSAPASATRRVLLLHGWGGSIQSWQPVISDLLARDASVLALDFPGFGASSLPPHAWGVPDYTANLVALLQQLAYAPTNIIAHSFGGRVALVLAASEPAMVKRLLLVAAAGIRTERPAPLRSLVTRTGKAVFRLPGLASMREQVIGMVGSRDYVEAGPLRETFSKVVAQDLRPYAERITAPTLLVWGDLDTETPLAQARVLETLIPDSGLVLLEGAGHFCYLERLPRFLRIVAEFLKD